MRIRHLPETLINRIAAGEVIERPAAAIKELVENSIDAGATHISVDIRDGGKTYICVQDNGCGMSREELEACLDRHATSKLPGDDLLDIRHLGFRGEALPSIASVSKVHISTRFAETGESWDISAEGGQKSPARPGARHSGTKIEVRDLFYATPARLKFLKTERSESMAIKDTITRLAMAAPQIGFTLTFDDRKSLHLQPETQTARLGHLLGRDFPDNAMPIRAERENVIIEGMASLPTYNKSNGLSQFLFVNGRAVKDRLLLGALKGAYSDVLARDRYPVVALFFTLPPTEVDVNVHPAKAEVRFRDAAHMRGLLVSTIRHALVEYGGRSAAGAHSISLSETAANDRPPMSFNPLPVGRGPSRAVPASYASQGNRFLAENAKALYEPFPDISPSARAEPSPVEETGTDAQTSYPLGAARAQIHENYIIAQTDEGMVIIDQHAAHERLVYEKLKAQQAESRIASQGLLTPEIIELDEFQVQELLSHKDYFMTYGLEIESFGPNAIAVAAIPALLGTKINIRQLLLDISEEIEEHGVTQKLEEKIFAILSRTACHGSIRSGRRMTAEEMNHLLREMEKTPLSGQCNHGRPTYIKLSLNEIEKLFKRR